MLLSEPSIMALLSLGPVASHVLIMVVAMCNMCILSYDAGMINNLNTVKPFVERMSSVSRSKILF